jgi:hypothetical protein
MVSEIGTGSSAAAVADNRKSVVLQLIEDVNKIDLIVESNIIRLRYVS